MKTQNVNLPRTVKGIILDVDGTLYDQRPLRLSMARLLLVELLKNPRSGLRSIRLLRAYREAHETLRGSAEITNLEIQQIELACRKMSMTPVEATAIVDRFFHTAPLERLHRFTHPGLIPFLKTAQSRGIRLGVLSDYPALAKLKAMNIDGYFEAVISSSDPQVNRLKPDPTGLNFCMAQLGVRPEHTVYVGDRFEVDAECAYHAEVCPIILTSRSSSSHPNLRYPVIQSDSFEKLSQMLFEA